MQLLIHIIASMAVQQKHCWSLGMDDKLQHQKDVRGKHTKTNLQHLNTFESIYNIKKSFEKDNTSRLWVMLLPLISLKFSTKFIFVGSTNNLVEFDQVLAWVYLGWIVFIKLETLLWEDREDDLIL